VLQATGNDRCETQNLTEDAGAAVVSDQLVTHIIIGSRFITQEPVAITMQCSMLTIQMADFDRALLDDEELCC